MRDRPIRRLPFPKVAIFWSKIFPSIWWQLDPCVHLAIPTTVPFLFPSHQGQIFPFCVPKESMPTWRHARFLIDVWLSFAACLQCKVAVVFFLYNFLLLLVRCITKEGGRWFPDRSCRRDAGRCFLRNLVILGLRSISTVTILLPHFPRLRQASREFSIPAAFDRWCRPRSRLECA